MLLRKIVPAPPWTAMRCLFIHYFFSAESAPVFLVTGCMSIPHSGHLAGVELVLSGCIGQAYWVQVLGSAPVLFSEALFLHEKISTEQRRREANVIFIFFYKDKTGSLFFKINRLRNFRKIARFYYLCLYHLHL